MSNCLSLVEKRTVGKKKVFTLLKMRKMRKFNLLVLVLLFIVMGFYGCTKNNRQPLKVNLILDTDFGADYDDVGAMAVLQALADSGKVDILATIASTKYNNVAAVLNVFNTYFKRPNIPIGVPTGNALTDKDWQGWSDTLVAKYPHSVKKNSDVLDAVELYRKILASQPDTSVTIVSIGFLTNLSNLLQSTPDKYSSLSGKELVVQKVKKLVSMAGAFPNGKEFNVYKDSVASKYAYENWPTKIVFSGFEIGESINTGYTLVHNASIVNSPVKDVFRISMPKAKEDSIGRMSWDQTAVLIGVLGTNGFFEFKKGKILINTNGSNTWQDDPNGEHSYVVQKMKVQDITKYIESLMMHQPLTKE